MRIINIYLLSALHVAIALPWIMLRDLTQVRKQEMVEMRVMKRKREDKRDKEKEPVLPVDLLFGEEINLGFKSPSKTYLSDDVEHMDAATLLHLIEKLKEEYAGKVARGEDAEKVRNSFDKLAATLHSLSRGANGRPDIAGTLAMLSEEEPDEEDPEPGMMYGGDYYSDLYGGEEDGDLSDQPDPSLLQLQAWTRKLSVERLLNH